MLTCVSPSAKGKKTNMNSNIAKLYKVANKKKRNIIGLMSGTSVDGLDVALCNITGRGNSTKVVVQYFATVTHTANYKAKIASIFSKQQVELPQLTLINKWVGVQHAKMVLKCLSKWNINPSKIDCIASHGQTIYHAPLSLHQLKEYGNATLQIGDGDHLAVTSGILTLSDFRQKHIAAGGEGAPLAVYGDYFIFGKKGEHRIMLNIGGIANFTYLPASGNMNEIFCTDVGPGNTLLDAYCLTYCNCAYDKNGTLANKGVVNNTLLTQLEKDTFFTKKFPKTTGPELFNLNYLHKCQIACKGENISHNDILRTLVQFTANGIANAIKKTILNNTKVTVYTSGGGMHNKQLMSCLKALLPQLTFTTTSSLNVNPDAKEAVLFAILANEALAGNKKSITTIRSDIPSVSMGKISFAN